MRDRPGCGNLEGSGAGSREAIRPPSCFGFRRPFFGRRLTEQALFPSPAEPPIGTVHQSAGARSVQAGTRGAKRRGGEALTGRVTADINPDAMGGGAGEGMP